MTSNIVSRIPGLRSSGSRPAYFWVIALTLACCLLPALLLKLCGQGSDLRQLSVWLAHGVHGGDSWTPISDAIAYVDHHASGAGLYEETYFKSDSQFIYSPQGLALFVLIRDLAHFDIWSMHSANAISWFVLPLLAALLFRLLTIVEVGAPALTEERHKLILRGALAICATLFFYPLLKGYALGQIQNWLTASLCLSMIFWVSGRSFLAGCFLGLCALVKPHVVILGLWALCRKDWRMPLGAGLVIGLLSIASLAMFGWAVHFEYLDLLGYLSKRGESYYASHSFESMFYRMLHNGNNMVWDGTHTQLVYVPWVHYLSSFLGLSMLLLSCLPKRGSGAHFRLADYGIAQLAVLLASPVAYDHHFGIVYAIAPAAALIYRMHGMANAGMASLGIFAYVAISGYFPILDTFADTDINVIQSYRLFGALAGFAFLYWLRGKLAEGASPWAVKGLKAVPVG